MRILPLQTLQSPKPGLRTGQVAFSAAPATLVPRQPASKLKSAMWGGLGAMLASFAGIAGAKAQELPLARPAVISQHQLCDAPERRMQEATLEGPQTTRSLARAVSLHNRFLAEFLTPASVIIKGFNGIGSNPSSYGSGFICRNEKLENGKTQVLVATANHVLPPRIRKFNVTLSDGRTSDVSPVHRNEQKDIAFLAFESEEPLPTLALATDAAQGETACFMGHVAGLEFTFKCGDISHADREDLIRRMDVRGQRQFRDVPDARMIQMAVPGVDYGDSGGLAARYDTGEVLGLVQSIGAVNTNTPAFGIGLLVHGSEVAGALREFDQQRRLRGELKTP